MVEDEKGAAVEASRLRRITGPLLVVLGLIFLALDFRVAVLYGHWFESEDRIRFVFWLWLGSVLTLAGAWLAFRIRIAGWAVLIAIPSLAVIAFSYGRWWS